MHAKPAETFERPIIRDLCKALTPKLRPTAHGLPLESSFVRAHVTRLPHPQKSVCAMVACSILALAISTEPGKSQPPACSDSVTAKNFSELTISQPDHAALVRKVHDRLRLLRAVVERLPRHFTPYKHVPEYRLTYYLEKLECGHERFYFPQAGPPAKRRFCALCSAARLLPEKKPVVSVSLPTDQEKQA